MASPGTTAIASLLGQFYDKLFLDNLYKDLYFYNFGDRKRIPPGSGKIVYFQRYVKLAASNTTSLTDGTILGTCVLSATRLAATAAGHGIAVKHSDFLIMTALSDVVADSVNECSKALALKVDNVTRAAISAAGNLLGASSLATIKVKATTAARVTDFIRATTKLRSLDAKTFPDTNFVSITHPNVLHDVMTQGNSAGAAPGSWIDVNKYATNDTVGRIYRGEVGKIYGVRFVMSTNIPRLLGSAANSATTGLSGVGGSGYNTFIFGPGAYGVVDLDGGSAKTFIKQLGSAGTADPINQHATVGAKVYFAAVNLDATNRLVRLASGKTFV